MKAAENLGRFSLLLTHHASDQRVDRDEKSELSSVGTQPQLQRLGPRALACVAVRGSSWHVHVFSAL